MHVRAHLNRALRKLGYELAKAPALPPVVPDRYKRYQYLADRHLFRLNQAYGDAAGSGRAAYRTAQSEGNARKIDSVWTDHGTIAAIAEALRQEVPKPVFGLCHGTRRGLEQQWFAEVLGCPVIGTEIADGAAQFANTVQADFHDRVADWIGRADFVYSNSWDHAFDPEAAFEVWLEQLRIGGNLVLEAAVAHGPLGASRLDPFGADPAIVPYLIADWFGDRVVLHRILHRLGGPNGTRPVWAFLFRRLR